MIMSVAAASLIILTMAVITTIQCMMMRRSNRDMKRELSGKFEAKEVLP
jgi:hypothetical protein